MALENKKVYLSGAIVGSYRSQNIIKVLADAGIPFCTLPIAFHITSFCPRLLRRLFGYIALAMTLPLRILFILNSTHVIVLPMNWSTEVYLELFFAKLFRKEIIVDYYISIYDSMVNDRKTVSVNSFAAKKLLFKDNLLLKLATKIIFLNKSESIYYQSIAKYKVDQDKVRIIPLVIDFKKERFELITISDDSSSDSNFNICWWGTYIPLHGLVNIIAAFEFLKGEKIILNVFGDSDLKSKPYVDLIKKLGVESNVKINNEYSFTNGKLAPFLIQNCNLALGNFGESEKARTVLVNKLVDSLALGLPCLTIETKATKELLNEGDGIIYTTTTPSEIAKKILELSVDRSYLATVGKNGFQMYLNKFSPDKFKTEFIKVFH